MGWGSRCNHHAHQARMLVTSWSLRGFERLEHRLVLSTLRVASWNVFDGPVNSSEDADFETVLEAIGNESLNDVARPVDIMTLAEANASIGNRLEDILDGLYNTTSYQVQLANQDFGGDRTGFIYDTSTVQLVGSQQIISGMTHPSLRGQFRPVGTSGEFDFYVYSIHLKAFGSASDMEQREQEMQALRANADSLGEGANIVMLGDFNLTGGSAEAAWSEALAAGPGRLNDAADSPGQWSGNASFKHLHSWNSADLGSRLDLHFFSEELEDGIGLEYVQGSARPFGNNGTHTFSQGISTGNGAAPNVLAALEDASDHLPIVSDFKFDVAEVLIEESGGGTAVAEDGVTDTYTVALAATPLSNVTVTVTPDAQVDLGAGAGNPMMLTFTPNNASDPQSITVTAIDDAVQEGTHFSTLTHTTTSSDTEFDNLPVDDLIVTIFDNEASSTVINEVDADTSGLDTLEFVELYDGGVGNMSLDGLSLVFFNGSDNLSYLSLDLDGWSTNAAGFFVAGNANVTNVDLVVPDNSIQNGADAVGLYLGNEEDFPIGSSVTTVNLIDALVYDTDDVDDAELLVLLNPGQPQVNENENGNRSFESMARVLDGGVARNTDTYVVQLSTPGATNVSTSGGININTIDDVTVAEAGTTDAYEVSLDSVPTVNVMLTLDPDANLDLGSGAGVPMMLTFTPSNALLPQTVTVSAVDDMLIEGQHTGSIMYSVASGDGAYDGLFVADTIVKILDNDQPAFVINEVDADTAGVDMLEFVEIYDGGTGNVSLDGYSLVFFNGNGDSQYAGYDLDGYATDADGFFVLGNTAVANVDFIVDDSSIQNGADAVALYLGNASNFLNVTTTDLIDAVVYDTGDGDDFGLLSLLNPGQPQLDERGGGNGTGHSNSRVPDGGIPRNTDTFVQQDPTPGTYNSDPPTIDGDFDDNLVYDCQDVDALVAVIAAMTNDLSFDLTADNLVDGNDLTQWLAEAGSVNLPSGSPYLPGDASLDGTVDGADFLAWNANKFSSTPAWCAGDFNADGTIDGGDFLIWNANKFQSSNRALVVSNGIQSDVKADVGQPRSAADLPAMAATTIELQSKTVLRNRYTLADRRTAVCAEVQQIDVVFSTPLRDQSADWWSAGH